MRPAELPSRSTEKRYVHLLFPIFEGEGRVACRPRFARECNADHDRHAMGKNRERIRFSPRPGRRGSPGEGRTCRTRRAARRLSRLLRGEISSCSTSWRALDVLRAGPKPCKDALSARFRDGAHGSAAKTTAGTWLGRECGWDGNVAGSCGRGRRPGGPPPAQNVRQPRAEGGVGTAATSAALPHGTARFHFGTHVFPHPVPQGPEMFFPSRLLGAGGKSG